MPEPRVQPAPSGGGAAAKREKPIFDELELGPWHGRVRVVPITGLASQLATTQFEVLAEWTGPPLPGLPPSDVPVSATDTYLTADKELAFAIARRVVDQLRRPWDRRAELDNLSLVGDDIPPDLRLTAKNLGGA